MDQATAQQYLAEAETARHLLATGTREVEISTADGRRTTYASASLKELDSYIAQLRSAASPCGRRPIGFRF